MSQTKTQDQILSQSALSIIDAVTNRIKLYEQENMIEFPKGYNYKHALTSARFALLDAETRDKKPVLTECTKESIANALFEMVAEGLSPMKKQCYFIAYGKELNMQRSYFGNLAIASRNGLQAENLFACEVFQGDVFKYEFDANTKRMHVVEHKQDLANRDNELIGAYAIGTTDNGKTITVIMSVKEVKQAWLQGQQNSPARDKFSGEFAKKTAINRLLKMVNNTAADDFESLEASNVEVKTKTVEAEAIEVKPTISIAPKEETSIIEPESDQPETTTLF